MHKRTLWKVGPLGLWFLLAAGVSLPTPAKADTLNVSLQPSSTSVSAGDTGSFDVLLTDATAAGGLGVTIGSFGFELQTSNSDVALTDANTSTVGPYIFSSQSFADLLGGDLTSPISTPTDLIADDFALGPGTTIVGGQTLDLGHVLFAVSPTAATETVNISFADLDVFTNLSDPFGNDIPINIATGAALNVTGSTGTLVPEPSSLSMLLCIIPIVFLIGFRTRYKLER